MSAVAFSHQHPAAALARLDAGRSRIFTQAGLGTFLVGVASGIPIQAVGRLFIGELFLIALAPVVVLLLLGLSGQYGKTARMLLAAMAVSWLGYLLSDLVRGTPSSDYVRGWSRWIAMGASFATLAWLGSKNLSLVLSFLVGLSVGACATPFIAGGFLGPVFYWKFYASGAVCTVALIAVRRFSPWVSVATLIGLAMTSIVLDTRSVALLCMVAAGVSALAARRSAGGRSLATPVSKTSMIAAGVLVAFLLVAAIYVIQYFGDRYGYSKRFRNSNATRLASATVAWSAVKESPIIGYGSWPRDPELARQRDKLVVKAKGVPTLRGASQEDLIIAHSQILQGWLEGGLLGLAFFLLLSWHIARVLLWQAFVSPYMAVTPILTFIVTQCAWHLLFSPFSGAQRLGIPAACVFICYANEKIRELKAVQVASRAAMVYPGWQPAV
ncbi:MAG: hypothetical protein DCC67_05435 [Planctomycetota bacterium]|nr:MAG: hypothetical protein DCC67_05435 [Planctomycetota bacterium]